MRRFIVLLILAVIALPAMSYASIHGVLKGKVVDTDGRGVIGASVRVEGTTQGAAVRNPNGEFTIANIVAGTYNVRITAVGKNPYVVEVRITADQTSNINVTLRDEAFETETIIVYGDKDLVNHTQTGSIQTLTSDDLTMIAREGLASVVAMSSGVTQSGSGFSIRGSRASESQVRFNGLDIGSQFTGGFGGAGSYYAPIVSTYATEEVQVLKGSFSAEHGEALGGIVNTVPKTGRTDRFEGFLRYRTDVPAFFGRQKDGLRVYKDGTRWKAEDHGEGAKLQGKNEHLIEFGIGGPLPLLKHSTFFISSNYLYEEFRSASFDIRDPHGNNLGLIPDNQAWRKNITSVLRFSVANNISLIVGGMYGTSNFENSGWGWLYANDYGYPSMLNGKVDPHGIPMEDGNGIPERIAKQNVINIFLANAYARINHSLSESSFYELTISTNIQNEASARRKGWDAPNYFTGFDMYEPEDIYIFDGISNRLMLAPTENGRPVSDKIIDIYQPIYEVRNSVDGYLRRDFIGINPLTGYYEGAPNATGTNNAYGMANAFRTHGASGGFQFREGSYIQIDGNYTNLFSFGEFKHNVKAGFEVRFFEQHRHQNSTPYDGNPFYDIYTDRWGGNLYSDGAELYDITSKPFQPVKIAGYVQDQLSYKGIVISGGLRFDLFDAQSAYRNDLSGFISIRERETALFTETPMKFQVSPRINITYPITARSNISIAYGMYFKTPMLSSLFDNYNLATIRSGSSIGNPNMDAEKSRQYEVAYRNQLSDDFVLTVTTYFKDTYNQMGMVYVAATPEPFNLLEVSEFSNARGIELDLLKRPANNLMFNINYALSFSEGTSSGPYDNASPQIDTYTGRPAFPLATYPLNNDVRHSINLNTTFYWLNDEGPSIGGFHVLENTNLTFTGRFVSGSPYTRLDLNYVPISERNAERGPSFWSLDARFNRAFNMSDWFGDGFKNSRIEFFADIRNMLNMRGPTGFYTTTGDPIDNGRTLDREVGTFSATPWYREANYAEAASFGNEQYDSYGNRLYNENADLDGNGIITQAEKHASYLKQAETSMKFRNLFRSPIRVFVGFNVSF